jgi:hypothetical protein
MTDDRSGDTSDDMSGDGRWMTYDELAKLRGIARASAERLVQRNHWRRQRGNDRTVRILVPMDSVSDDMSDDVSADTTGLLAGAIAALEDAVRGLRGQLTAANARAERAEQGRDGERQRADDLRARIEVLNAELVVARDAAQNRDRGDARAAGANSGCARSGAGRGQDGAWRG